MNLKELSQHLGLSQTTVSRALDGYPEVARKTRQRVRQAAAKYGYRPNSNARRLATGRAGAVGIVLTMEKNMLIEPHYTLFLAGLSQALAPHDMDILVRVAPKHEQSSVYRRLAETRRVDTFIVSSPYVEDWRIALLGEIGIPFVVHGRSVSQQPYAYMDIDNEGAFFAATRALIERGHRRIGLINGEARFSFARDRKAGWQAAQKESGIAVDDRLCVSIAMTEKNGYHAACMLLEANPPPSALLCTDTLSAYGVYRALAERGLRVGKDISIIAHDDGLPLIRPQALIPSLSTTTSPIADHGRRVAQIALGALERDVARRDPVDPVGEVWPVRLDLRDSVAPCPQI